MSLVEFEEENFHPEFNENNNDNNTSKILDYIVSIGLAKSKEHAEYILIGVVAVLILISLFIFVSSFGNKGEKFKSDEFPSGYLNDIQY